ncbi:3-oxoacyl-ACP reductase [Tepiditoga spiralis]|uniref:3-oxoacyl-ACP reductase n=1 Tax=Tepiditoga spiralis TaxID=2108365 RepID=A0A7G1G7Y4_9BACT|nr:SDR family NAD(P)-dependent oxidoreductase [Tepiditoga spiralis]BBE31324.1 3-oxoacyl-ACP reductase [Tepiditoga spiralis]
MKSVILTGASSGIGFETAKVLIENNYKVYGFGRDFSKIEYEDKNFIKITCDITNVHLLNNEIKKIIKKDNNIKVLINNAGFGLFGMHEELNIKELEKMIDTNLKVPIILSKLLLRSLKKNNGYIINVSSVTAFHNAPKGAAYSATKAGLTHFSESLFEEVRKYGVKVISINPDITKTNFYNNLNFKYVEDKNFYIDPKEIANIINFILNQNSIITQVTVRPQKNKIEKK